LEEFLYLKIFFKILEINQAMEAAEVLERLSVLRMKA
jgi:hypothetical protein